jgi:hypothetical protein
LSSQQKMCTSSIKFLFFLQKIFIYLVGRFGSQAMYKPVVMLMQTVWQIVIAWLTDCEGR